MLKLFLFTFFSAFLSQGSFYLRLGLLKIANFILNELIIPNLGDANLLGFLLLEFLGLVGYKFLLEQGWSNFLQWIFRDELNSF